MPLPGSSMLAAGARSPSLRLRPRRRPELAAPPRPFRRRPRVRAAVERSRRARPGRACARRSFTVVAAARVELGDAAALRLAGRRPGAQRSARASTLVPGRRQGRLGRARHAPRRRAAAPRTLDADARATSPPGATSRRLHATGPRGATLRRTARASGRRTLRSPRRARRRRSTPAAARRAPCAASSRSQGAYSFGGAGGALRRRAPRPRPPGAGRHRRRGHARRAPVAGRSSTGAPTRRAAPATTSCVRGDDGRDYAFMHFQAGSTVVEKGQRVAAGQRLAQRRQHRRLARARTCTSRSGPTAGTRRLTRTRSTRCPTYWPGPPRLDVLPARARNAGVGVASRTPDRRDRSCSASGRTTAGSTPRAAPLPHYPAAAPLGAA